MTKIKITTLTLLLICILSSKSLMAYFNQCPKPLHASDKLPLPIGSYINTCQNCRTMVSQTWGQGHWFLSCNLICDHCNGRKNWTSLNYTYCDKDIANCDGSLRCGSCS